MVEIEFSAIVEMEEEIQALRKLLSEFQARFGISIKLRLMNWENAWSELLSYALYGKEPDVSHIGSTWCSSMVEMNALRFIKTLEIAQIGGKEAFLKPAWLSSMVEEDTRTWSIPWTGYANVLAFRRDLFAKAGLTDANPLESNTDIFKAVQALQNVGIDYPFILPTTGTVDLLHAAASWVWDTGGDFVDPIEKKVLFTKPESLSGLCNFFELFRCMPSPVEAITPTQCSDLFASGKAAISLINTKSLLGIIRQGTNLEVTRNISTAATTHTPWFGGGNLILWKHTQYSVEKERAAINLVRFLTSLQCQTSFSAKADELPVTSAAYEENIPSSHPLSPALKHVVSNGKPYRATHLWGRVERLLGQAMETIAVEVRSNPSYDIGAVLSRHLEPLARRLDMTLTTS